MTDERPQPDQPTESAALPPPTPAEDDEPFALRDYVVVNALFLGFLAAIFLLMRLLFADSAGLWFFFLVLGIGFVAVSVYDFLFDRLYTPPADEER